MKSMAAMVGMISMSASLAVYANDNGAAVADSVIEQQNQKLLENTAGKGFGPQSPRDLSNPLGENTRQFSSRRLSFQRNLL